MTAIPSPLRPPLGPTLEALDESRLQRVLGTEENQHREFKGDVESSKEARLGQIRDLVSSANSGGGLVLFGVDEDRSTHTASALSGLGTDVDVVRQLEQIVVAGRTRFRQRRTDRARQRPPGRRRGDRSEPLAPHRH